MQQNQVVITLTLEQFARLQQLANIAGAESVNAFAKEKLLAAILGTTTPLVINSMEAKNSSLQPLVSELKRMHIELKELVTESLEKHQVAPGKELTSSTKEANQEDFDHFNQKQSGLSFPLLDNLSANQNLSGLHDPLQELLGPGDPSDTPKPAEKNKGLTEQDALLNAEEDFLAAGANIEFDEDDAFAVPPIMQKEQSEALNIIKKNLAKEDKNNKKSRQNVVQSKTSSTPDTMPDSKDNNSSLSNKESTASDQRNNTSNKKPKDPSIDSAPSTFSGPPPKKRK